MSRKPTLAVDFDGTIVDHEFPGVGKIKPGAKEALIELSQHFTIVISSCRTSAMFKDDPNRGETIKAMMDCLDQAGIPYDRIDMGNEGKIVAWAYIDDRGIRFNDNWPEIAQTLLVAVKEKRNT